MFEKTLNFAQADFPKFRRDIKDSVFCQLIDYLIYCSEAVHGLFSGRMGSGYNLCQELLCITRVSFRGHHWLPWGPLKCLYLLLMRLVIHIWTSEVHLSIFFFCSKYLGCCGLEHIIYCTHISDIKYTLRYTSRALAMMIFFVTKQNAGRNVHSRMLNRVF